MASITAPPPVPPLPRLPLTIYFDGSCRLCRSEIDNLAARDLCGALVLVDCAAPDFSDCGMPVSHAQMMRSIHGRFADGTWINGVDVFIVAYEAADLPWVSRVLAHRLVRPSMARLYPWLARYRYLLSAIGVPKLLNWFAARARQAPSARHLAAQRAAEASTRCSRERDQSGPGGNCA
jgi:predicted DCC family thiol-disulfide oxidoreductase YuxK